MDLKAIAMGLAFALIWSAAFTTGRMIVLDAPPLYALTLRFLISGVIGVALALAMGQTWRLTRVQWRAVIIFGVMQNAIYLGLNFMAMQRVEASVAAIFASAMPLMVALAGWLLFKDRLRPMAIIGLILGFGGVVVIMGARLTGGLDPIGLLLCLIAAAALTVATLSMRKASGGQSGNLMMVVGIQLLIGSASVGLAAVLFEDWVVRWSWRLGGAFAFTTLVSGLLATWIWFWLVARIGAVKASTFHFLNPFFGVFIAYLVLGEAIGVTDVIGVVVITVGILLVQISRQVKVA